LIIHYDSWNPSEVGCMFMDGVNDGITDKKERPMPKNQKSTKKKYPKRPITGKEWVTGYREWIKENKRIIMKELKKHG